jgi:hypothetical protein
MDGTETSFTDWLAQAQMPEARLTPEVRALLRAAFQFRQAQGEDYYSRRLLSHLLLHCGCGLKVAPIARLTGFSRSTASKHQGLSSKEVIQAAHHRMAGRPHGKLLPRYAGPVAQFLTRHPDATHYDTLDFIHRTWGVRVSLQTLHTFLNTYGLDRASSRATPADPERGGGPGAAPEGPGPPPRPLPAQPVDPPPARVPATPVAPPAPAQPVPLPPPSLLWAPTQYAGAFLLLPQALRWLAIADDCFRDDFGCLRRGLLTSVFGPLVGLRRIFHLDQMTDRGFAVLTGGQSCPSRHPIGGWRRHLSWHEVDAFCRRTFAWEWVEGADARVSFDDHVVPRWTHKFHIPKGYVTTRNKYMRCEKLFFGYDVWLRRYLCVQAARGGVGLHDVATPLIRQVLRQGRPRSLHALCDAAAGKSDADVRALWDLAEEEANLTVTLRACRYPSRVARWKQLPSGLFVRHEEPGPYVGAPPKEIRLAETETALKGEAAEQAVRTVICREVVPGPKKDRWHPLFTTSGAEPHEVLTLFRARQYHEQAYRVGVYDEFLDAVPCGYDKQSPDPKRPRFQRGPLQMMGWLVALVYNAVSDWASTLAGDFAGCQVRTLRRMFFNRPGTLYETPEALIVQLDRFGGQEALVSVVDAFNAARHRLPWLENRQVVISLTPQARPRAGP